MIARTQSAKLDRLPADGRLLALVGVAVLAVAGLAVRRIGSSSGLKAQAASLISMLPETRFETWPEGAQDVGGVVRFRRIPFPVVRKYIVPGSVTRKWKVQAIPFAKIHATQFEVTDRGLYRYLKEPPRRDEDLPLVLHLFPDDVYEVQDGHHRLVAAWLGGKPKTLARVAGFSKAHPGRTLPRT